MKKYRFKNLKTYNRDFSTVCAPFGPEMYIRYFSYSSKRYQYIFTRGVSIVKKCMLYALKSLCQYDMYVCMFVVNKVEIMWVYVCSSVCNKIETIYMYNYSFVRL